MSDQVEQVDPVEAYQSAVKTCALCARFLIQHDLPQLLQDIAKADVVGPLFDPTSWMNNSKAMNEDRQLIEAAMPLWKFAKMLEGLREKQLAGKDGG